MSTTEEEFEALMKKNSGDIPDISEAVEQLETSIEKIEQPDKAKKKAAKKAAKKAKKDGPKISDDPFGDLGSELKEFSVISGHSDAANDLRGYISTGCFILDADIGQGLVEGGYPIGRFTELFGVEGCGKTTMATHAMVSCQNGRGIVLDWKQRVNDDGRLEIYPVPSETKMEPGLSILLDSEFKFPLDRAQRMGLDPRKMIRVVPKMVKVKGKGEKFQALTLEYGLEEIEKVLKKVMENPYFQQPQVPVLVVWDSLAASPIEVELEGSGMQEGIASKARKVRTAMRRITGLLSHLNVTVLILNQIYDRIGMPGVVSSGGRGLKFHASHRMQIKGTAKPRILVGTEQVGIRSEIQCVKSSICPPTQKLEIPILFKTGLNENICLLDFFLSPGKWTGKKSPIEVKGSWYYVTPPGETEAISFQRSGWDEFLEGHPVILDYLRSEVMSYYQQR